MNSKIILFLALFMGALDVYAVNTAWQQELAIIEANILAYPDDLPTLTKGVIAYNNYAQMLIKQQDYQQAIEYFKKALSIAPEQAYIKYNISNAYLNWAKVLINDDVWQAMALSQIALEYNRNNLEAYNLNKLAESLAITTNTISITPVTHNIEPVLTQQEIIEAPLATLPGIPLSN